MPPPSNLDIEELIEKNTGGAWQQVNLCMGRILTAPSQMKPYNIC